MPLDEGDEGRPEVHFEGIYQELDLMLEDYTKPAEERRKKEVTHVPVAVSIPQLIKKVCFSVLYIIKVKTSGFFRNQLHSKLNSLLKLRY